MDFSESNSWHDSELAFELEFANNSMSYSDPDFKQDDFAFIHVEFLIYSNGQFINMVVEIVFTNLYLNIVNFSTA